MSVIVQGIGRKKVIYCVCVCVECSLIQGQGQYHKSIKTIEEDIQKAIKQVNELTGIKESDTGLAAPALWDLAADKQTLTNEQPLQVLYWMQSHRMRAVRKAHIAHAQVAQFRLQVARCTKIINADSDDPKYIINVKQFAKFVVDLADSVAPTDIEEGMRVGYVRIQIYVNIGLATLLAIVGMM